MSTLPEWSWSCEHPDGRKLTVTVVAGPSEPLQLHAVERGGNGVVDLELEHDTAYSLASFLADWAGIS